MGRGNGTGCGGLTMTSTPCPKLDAANRKNATRPPSAMRFMARILDLKPAWQYDAAACPKVFAPPHPVASGRYPLVTNQPISTRLLCAQPGWRIFDHPKRPGSEPITTWSYCGERPRWPAARSFQPRQSQILPTADCGAGLERSGPKQLMEQPIEDIDSSSREQPSSFCIGDLRGP